MNWLWRDWKGQWSEAQVAFLNLPTDDPTEAALIEEIQERMSELYNLRADNSEDAPTAAPKPKLTSIEGGR
ncbi:hypothetical protein GCM10007385_35110 [Tateyamaria omphalii]|uniref:hypothetical protein n=1 Tax=Tateyamaria omphalii TaxID=299262 RepID=UPI0016760C21|nr:hypothetical protein [Tateyamaria omphalii]GGX62961.1 hypothetical protein GCM10007385_35110 [Tateyamaria omphalii]